MLWAGRAEQDAARSHSSNCIETQYIFCMVNPDELCQIHQSSGITYVARLDARVWVHACLRVGTARCQTGRLDGDANGSKQQMWDAWGVCDS